MNENAQLEKKLTPKLYLVLATAIELLNADKGNIQFYSKESNILTIMAQIGFNDAFLSHFKSVAPGEATCGVAFRSKRRVVVENVATDPFFAHLKSVFHSFGYSAVQSTPLCDPQGDVFAILSTHFSHPHRPSETEFGLLDNYLERAIPVILNRLQ